MIMPRKLLLNLGLAIFLMSFIVNAPVFAQGPDARARLEAAIRNANNPQAQAGQPATATPAAVVVPAATPAGSAALPKTQPTAKTTTVTIPPGSKQQTTVQVSEAPDAATEAEIAEFMEASKDDDDHIIKVKRPLSLRDQAFKQMLDKISPLTPDQIIEMRKQQDKTQRAVATYPTTPPRPVSSTLTIDLSPGATPPVIRLGSGFVTSLVFVDSTGQSWPIADYSLGNPKNFNIQWDKKTNTLFIQSTTTYNSGNMAIRLAKLDTPLMISLVSGQKEIDYRVDLQVPGRGPNALAVIMGDNLPPHPAPILLSVLDGVPPPGSQELVVSGGCGRAWIWKGKMIFRTQLTILSPAWTATVSSIDGTHVYEMNPTPLILGLQNGKTVKVHLTGI